MVPRSWNKFHIFNRETERERAFDIKHEQCYQNRAIILSKKSPILKINQSELIPSPRGKVSLFISMELKGEGGGGGGGGNLIHRSYSTQIFS